MPHFQTSKRRKPWFQASSPPVSSIRKQGRKEFWNKAKEFLPLYQVISSVRSNKRPMSWVPRFITSVAKEIKKKWPSANVAENDVSSYTVGNADQSTWMLNYVLKKKCCTVTERSVFVSAALSRNKLKQIQLITKFSYLPRKICTSQILHSIEAYVLWQVHTKFF